MIGLGVLLFLCIWGAIALLIASLIGKKLLKKFTKDAEGRTTSKGVLIILLLAVLVFFLPISDEIISYPTYYKMCQGAKDYKFANGMDEKRVLGRNYKILGTTKRIQIFPFYRDLSPYKKAESGVVVDVSSGTFVDAHTNEVLFYDEFIKPIRSAFAMPWDGGRIPWLLHECYPNEEFIYKLQLKRAVGY